MANRFETLTVALAVPLSNGNFSVGTGVPAAQGLVLTAHHVVCPDGTAPNPVRLRFWHAREREFAPDPTRKSSGFVDALVDRSGDAAAQRGIAWSSKALDVALVRSPHPASVGHATLGWREPFDDAEWRCEAFPHASWESGAPEPVRLTGRSHSRFPGTARFQIDADIAMRFTDGPATPRHTEGWSGASGAPLFVDGQVMGVLLARKPNGEAKILEGVPIVDCLEDADFCALLGIKKELEDPYFDELRSALATCSPRIRAQVGRALGVGETASTADIEKALRAAGIHTILEVLDGLRRNLDPHDDRFVRRVALCIAAHKFFPRDIAELKRAVFGSHSQMDICAAGSRMGAEFLMAAAEGRLPEFRPHAGAVALPPGRYALPQLPEAGCSLEANDHFGDIEARIGADLLQTEAWLEDVMGAVCDFPINSPQAVIYRREILQQELAFRAAPERRKPSYYFTEVDPGTERIPERTALQARLDSIREHYPQVGAVYIQPHLAPQDFSRFRPLRDMLPQGEE